MAANSYLEQDLTSDGFFPAARTDAKLINPWGIVAGPNGLQISEADSGFSEGFDASGNIVTSAVTVPGHAGAKGHPTGVVSNTDPTLFKFTGAGGQVSANFIFVTENGTIDAWSTANGNKTVNVVVDHSTTASYKGAAIAKTKTASFLYVANFKSGKIETFNSSFKPVKLSGSFTDPNLPKNYAPFNVQNIGGQLFVTYAKRGAGGTEVHAAGVGLIDVFNTSGNLVKRFATGGKLNAPWGLSKAPTNFGAFSGDILVGNFGDGRLNAFNPTTGKFVGQLKDTGGNPIFIDGLWGLAFGNGKGGTIKNALYFTAGVYSETHGLYGRLLVGA